MALKVIAPELAGDARVPRALRARGAAGGVDRPPATSSPSTRPARQDGLLFIAMRFVEGTTSAALIARRRAARPGRAARGSSRRSARALDAAHRAGLVHRDVKPANVLLADRRREHAYLTDFGLTRDGRSDTRTDARPASGSGRSTTWRPSRCAASAIDARADVYALGCVLYDALTGRPPFRGRRAAATMLAHLHEPPPAVAGARRAAARRLDAVVARAMAKEPDERYPSAGDLGPRRAAALGGEAPDEPERAVAAAAALTACRGRASARRRADRRSRRRRGSRRPPPRRRPTPRPGIAPPSSALAAFAPPASSPGSRWCSSWPPPRRSRLIGGSACGNRPMPSGRRTPCRAWPAPTDRSRIASPA